MRVRVPPGPRADVAELADAPDLGSGPRKGLGVRVPPSAPTMHEVKPYLVEGEVTVSAAEYAPLYEDQLRKLRRELNLPGFRPGQAPISYVRSRHGQEILSELLVRLFLQKLDEALGGRALIGLPAFSQEPDKVAIEPPLPDYRFSVRALVRPTTPLKLEGSLPVLYTYQVSAEDVPPFRRFLRLALGEMRPIEVLPEVLPLDKDLYVRFHTRLPGSGLALRLSWTSPLQPFPWSHFAQRKVGDTFTLEASAFLAYAELIRAVEPSFSPLEVGSLEAQIVSAAEVTPLAEADLATKLELAEDTPESWQQLLASQVQRTLERLNATSFQTGLLKAVGVDIPDDVLQYNYLLYLRGRQQQNGALTSYEEYGRAMAWRIFMESHLGTVPELEVSSETVQEEVWERLQNAPDLSDESKAFLEKLNEQAEEKQAFLQSLLGGDSERLVQSLQLNRFEKWLLDTYGPRVEKPLPLSTILLHLL